MHASGVTAPAIFAQGRMLSSLLSVCSQRIAGHCFALQVDRLGADWLKLFFDAFSVSIRKRACADAETRLGHAYTKAASNLQQKLSIKSLLLEQDVQDALRDCISPFAKPGACNAMTTEFTDEVNHWIGKQSGSVCPHVSKITNDQMRKFLNLFPCEVGINLRSATPSGSTLPQRCEQLTVSPWVAQQINRSRHLFIERLCTFPEFIEAAPCAMLPKWKAEKAKQHLDCASGWLNASRDKPIYARELPVNVGTK
jgi:hypothetical protein